MRLPFFQSGCKCTLVILIFVPMQKNFSQLLIKKYQEIKRNLPWRETSDPYKIWLSEVILQQTRVAQGLPYYYDFINRFETVTQLAEAPEDEVLRLWQGLGYYSRARNMHATAKEVVQKCEGVFPSTYEKLISLKGIGDYTASAIASFSQGEPVAVVDGNVIRVLSRLYEINQPADSSAGKKMFKSLAEELLDTRNSGLHNQAMMELGALICKPKNPVCEECPVSHSCMAFSNNSQTLFPVKKVKKPLKNRFLVFTVIEHNQKVWVQKRDNTEIWKGLYQFPLIEFSEHTEDAELLKKITDTYCIRSADIHAVEPEIKHILSHQRLFVRIVHVKADVLQQLKGFTTVEISELSNLAFPILLAKYIQRKFY